MSTLSSYLDGKIGVGSSLHTNEFASYPQVSENLHLNHRILNHPIGFVNENGTHNKNIEGFWLHFKSCLTKENGLKRSNINDWIQEYTFKRRYIVGTATEYFMRIFVEIMKIMLYE